MQTKNDRLLLKHRDHHRTIYFIGRVLIVACQFCRHSEVMLAPHSGEGDLSNTEALNMETRSTYAVTG